MHARLLLTAATLSLFAACTPSDAPGTNGRATSPPSSEASSKNAVKPRAKEGETCGGIAGILCEPSLFCKYDGAYPDAAGVCVK